MSEERPPSRLVVEELFARDDARFVPSWRALTDEQAAGAIAARVCADAAPGGRPAARAALRAYLDDGCDRPGHRGAVRTILRAAETAGDDEVMGRLLVAFDRLLRPRVTSSPSWRGDGTLVHRVRRPQGIPFRADGVAPARFSVVTRRALRRRALRYFRALGRRDPARFRAAFGAALRLYTDEMLASPHALLESWGLLVGLHGRAPQLRVMSHRVIVRAPARLDDVDDVDDVDAAPLHEDVWQDGTADLVALLGEAQARFVRRFARRLLERVGAEFLARPQAATLLPLLRSPHDEARALAALLIPRMVVDVANDGTPDVPLWRRLLQTRDPQLAGLVVARALQALTSSSLAVPDLVALARSAATPVASQAARWLLERGADVDTPSLLRAVDGPSPPARALAAHGLAQRLRTTPDVPALRELLDARHDDVRAIAQTLLVEEPGFRDDPLLWAALAESPFPDARAFLARHLKARAALLPHDAVPRLFAGALLATLGGGRTRAVVLTRLADVLVDDDGGVLLRRWGPLLAALLRSVRAGDRAAALACLARAGCRDAGRRAALHAALPGARILVDDDDVPVRAARGAVPAAAVLARGPR